MSDMQDEIVVQADSDALSADDTSAARKGVRTPKPSSKPRSPLAGDSSSRAKKTSKQPKRVRSSVLDERTKIAKASRGDDAPSSSRSLRSAINGSASLDKAVDASDAEDGMSAAESATSEYAPRPRQIVKHLDDQRAPSETPDSAAGAARDLARKVPPAGSAKLTTLESNIADREAKIKEIIRSIKYDRKKIDTAQERFDELTARFQRLSRKLERAASEVDTVKQTMNARIDTHLATLAATRAELADLARSHDLERLISILGEPDTRRRYSAVTDSRPEPRVDEALAGDEELDKKVSDPEEHSHQVVGGGPQHSGDEVNGAAADHSAAVQSVEQPINGDEQPDGV